MTGPFQELRMEILIFDKGQAKIITIFFQSTLKQWRVAFWVCFAILVITNVIYLIWAKGEQLWWDDVGRHGYPENWKHGPLASTDTDVEDIKPKQEIEEKY